MEKRKILIILRIILSCFLLGVLGVVGVNIQRYSASKITQPVVSEIQQPVVETAENSARPVTIQNIDNKYYKITIDYNNGISHKEIGRLLGKEIVNKIPDYAIKADESLESLINGDSEYSFVEDAKQIMKNLDKDYVDEIDGIVSQICSTQDDIAGDKKLSKDEFYLFNLTADLLRPVQCSASSVYGSKTTDGKTITGRNLDFDPIPALKALSAVTVFKQGDKSFCSIGFVGYMGVLSGFNNNKVFAAVLDTETIKPNKLNDIRSYSLDLRYALENNKTLDNAATFMADKNHNYYRDHIIFFSDPNTSKVLENDLRIGGTNVKRQLRTATSQLNDGETWGISDSVVSVNSFELKGNYNSMGYACNTERWETFKKLITYKKSLISFDDMKGIMSYTNTAKYVDVGNQADGSIYNIGTIQNIVFRPEDMRLEIAFAPWNGPLSSKPNFISIPIDFK